MNGIHRIIENHEEAVAFGAHLLAPARPQARRRTWRCSSRDSTYRPPRASNSCVEFRCQ
jgi:hypothetical protein